MDDAQERLIFVSHRTTRPEVFAEQRGTGEIVQLTDHDGINEWSVHPSHDGRYVYFTARNGAWRVDCETLKEDEVFHFGDRLSQNKNSACTPKGGTTSLSHDDRYWAVSVNSGKIHGLFIIDTVTGEGNVLTEHDVISQPEFHPSDNTLLRFSGGFHERIWVINRDGSGKRLAYRRKRVGDGRHYEWIVHETWRPGSREIITANWPRGCIGIDIDTGATRAVCTFNAWHPCINRQGDLMCADTTFPDIGLQLFDPLDGVGKPRALCVSGSSNVGDHWNTPYCPYDDGPIKRYAPGHTHPHPSFSPDGTKVVFTSDRSGHAQVYEVSIPSEGCSGTSSTAVDGTQVEGG